MTRRLLPSTEPLVPNSANKKDVTCSSVRFIRLQISEILAKIVCQKSVKDPIKSGEVGANLLVSFTETLWRGNLVALRASSSQIGMLRVEQRKESVEEKVVTDDLSIVMLPDTGALHHVTLFDWLSNSIRRCFTLGLVGLCKFGFEVIGAGLGFVSKHRNRKRE